MPMIRRCFISTTKKSDLRSILKHGVLPRQISTILVCMKIINLQLSYQFIVKLGQALGKSKYNISIVWTMLTTRQPIYYLGIDNNICEDSSVDEKAYTRIGRFGYIIYKQF